MKRTAVVLAGALMIAPLSAPAQATPTAQHTHDDAAARPARSPAPSTPDASAAQQWFERLKTLAGAWSGALTTEPHTPMAGADVNVTLRVTSRGNAILHNMKNSRLPDDPITMIYLEGDRLMLTHYCDAGNRPRMQGSISPDGSTLTFEFVDVAGPTRFGHMSRAVFTFADDNSHTQEWTYNLPNGSVVRARSALRRVASPST
jgi:hypothetical protein